MGNTQAYLHAIATGDVPEINKYHDQMLGQYGEPCITRLGDFCTEDCMLTLGQMVAVCSMVSEKSTVTFHPDHIPPRVQINAHADVVRSDAPPCVSLPGVQQPDAKFLTHMYLGLVTCLRHQYLKGADIDFDAIQFAPKMIALFAMGLSPKTICCHHDELGSWLETLATLHAAYEKAEAAHKTGQPTSETEPNAV